MAIAQVLDRPPEPSDFGTLIARLERLPVSRRLLAIRVIVGAATFFDAYTILAIAFAMPQLVREWTLSPSDVGMIISAGYLGQLVGALIFGGLAERFGRLRVLLFTILLFTAMDVACLLAWSAWSMIAFRFLQGIGTGGEVPVASAYVNEFIGAKRRGRFFLLYEVIFPVGLMFAGAVGYFLVPLYGWRAMFLVGLVPAILTIPLRWFMPESPRWLASRGRLHEADAVVTQLEKDVLARGLDLPPPAHIPEKWTPVFRKGSAPMHESGAHSDSIEAECAPVRVGDTHASERSNWKELFQGIYRRRTLMIWGLWLCAYLVNNGLITWLPTIYREVFKLPLQTSLAYGFTTSAFGVAASVVCALAIDKVGRRPWYIAAFLLGSAPLLGLAYSGAQSATEVLIFATAAYAVLQTITFSLYLYSAELYPTRLRAVGTGLGSAWLRIGSSIGPALVGTIVGNYGIQYVFAAFAAVAILGSLITLAFAIETKGRVLEELSP